MIGGRYGLSSKDFDPAMAKAVFDELKQGQSRSTASPSASPTTCRTPASTVDPAFDIEPPDVVRALFYGLGADGTVGANKNSDQDSRLGEPAAMRRATSSTTPRSPARTRSRICASGRSAMRAPYLLKSASFVGVHKFDFLFKQDVLAAAAPGATVLINSPYPVDEVWDELPRNVQQQIIDASSRCS